MAEWQYGGASATAQFQDGVCCVSLRGVVTDAIVRRLRQDMHALGDPPDAYVVDWSCSVLAMDPDELEAATFDSHTDFVIRTPVAYVVAPAMLEAFHDHCFNMIRHGLVRVTFTAMDVALAWACRKCAVAQLKAEAVAPRRAPPPQPLDSLRRGSPRTPWRAA